MKQIIKSTEKILKAYFQIPAKHVSPNRLFVSRNSKGKLQIIDTVNKDEYQINQKKNTLDAISLIDDFGLVYKSDPDSISVFFIEANIFE